MAFSISRFISGAGEGLAQTGKSMGDAARVREQSEALENLRHENDMKRQEMIESSKGAHEQARLTSGETIAREKIVSDEKIAREGNAAKYPPEYRDWMKNRGEKEPRPEKPLFPKWEDLKDEKGNIVAKQDVHSGAIMRMTKAKPGQAAEEPGILDTLSAKLKGVSVPQGKPAVPETPAGMLIEHDGKVYNSIIDLPQYRHMKGGSPNATTEQASEQAPARESQVEFSLNGPATGPPIQGRVPTEKDLRWLKAHPDLKDRFLMKFGALPEGLDLPE